MKLLGAFILAIAFFLPTSIVAQSSADHTVFFDVDKDEINEKEKLRLQEFIDTYNWDLISEIRIVGHTDSDADSVYNRRLSERRTENVRLFLEQIKNHPHMALESYGEDHPMNENADSEQKKINRRVEIYVKHVPDIVEEGPGIKELYRLLEQKKQEICVSAKGDTIIRLDQGTILIFPEYPFGTDVSGCIEIRAKEFYRKSDMVLENLSTTSNGQLLETEGMIFLEAFKGNRQLELARNKEVTILMPTDSLRSDVAIFDGNRFEHNDIMNWTRDNASQISGLNASAVTDCLDWNNSDLQMQCERCRLFFCRFRRIGKGVRGIFNKEVRQNNRAFRKCQRRWRRNGSSRNLSTDITTDRSCRELDSLFKLYGVNNREALMVAMNQELMDSLGVDNLIDLRDTLNAIKLRDIEKEFQSGNINRQNLEYYIFNRNRLGWINVDAFSKLPGERITMRTQLEANIHTDSKAVFQNVKGILPGVPSDEMYAFLNVPSGHPVLLVGLKYYSGQAYVSILETKTQLQSEKFDFHEVTLDELREELKILDR